MYFCCLLFLFSTLSNACLPDNAFTGIRLQAMFHDAILNNVRKSSSYFNFYDCDLVCVVDSLNKKNIKYTISGQLLRIKLIDLDCRRWF